MILTEFSILTSAVDILWYSHIEIIRSADDVIDHGGLLLVELLHGSAAAVVLNPLQNQSHDVDTEPTKQSHTKW